MALLPAAVIGLGLGRRVTAAQADESGYSAMSEAERPEARRLSQGQIVGRFAEDDPRPYCDRCAVRPSEVIVAVGAYLCRRCLPGRG